MSEETRHSSESGFLSALISRGPLNAGMFFSGPICGHTEFPADSEQGYVHLIHRGPVAIHAEGRPEIMVTRPSLVLLATPINHRFFYSEATGAELVCARLSFDNMIAHPRLLGFPAVMVLPFDEEAGLAEVSGTLFKEAFSSRFGRETAVNLLVELLLLYLLRHCVASGRVDHGILAGLADPKLARVLTGVQDDPARDWSVESLADLAGMSRASFAAHFKSRIGTSPGSYLTAVRLTLARQRLQTGEPLKSVAAQVGYKSATALSRTLARHFGYTPRDWQKGEIQNDLYGTPAADLPRAARGGRG